MRRSVPRCKPSAKVEGVKILKPVLVLLLCAPAGCQPAGGDGSRMQQTGSHAESYKAYAAAMRSSSGSWSRASSRPRTLALILEDPVSFPSRPRSIRTTSGARTSRICRDCNSSVPSIRARMLTSTHASFGCGSCQSPPEGHGGHLPTLPIGWPASSNWIGSASSPACAWWRSTTAATAIFSRW